MEITLEKLIFSAKVDEVSLILTSFDFFVFAPFFLFLRKMFLKREFKFWSRSLKTIFSGIYHLNEQTFDQKPDQTNRPKQGQIANKL